MRTFTLPGTDLTVPNVVLGLMRIQDKTDEEIRTLVGTALDHGIDFFDHADVYGASVHGCERRFAEVTGCHPRPRQNQFAVVDPGPHARHEPADEVALTLGGELLGTVGEGRLEAVAAA